MLKARIYCLLGLFTGSLSIEAQTLRDSIQELKSVVITTYPSRQSLQTTPASVVILTAKQLELTANQSLLPAINTLAGVRMEERSPGSYRLSVRGSLLRSPFGVRNVKVYLDDFPLTDAGGNTYLNLIDGSTLAGIQIIKGPDGSLFGANTGGVVTLNSQSVLQGNANGFVGLSAGSYKLFHQNLSINKKLTNADFSINQSFQYSDGYRDNSRLNRKYIQTAYNWNYNKNSRLKFMGFYSDLDYQTPGGLTLAQLLSNPRASRPKTATLPSAKEQHVGIKNATFFTGISNENRLDENWNVVSAIFASHTDFKNPFITNYEKRDETNFGIRAFSEYSKSIGHIAFTWNLGMELQQNEATIQNYDNNNGVIGNLQADDAIRTSSGFGFTRFTAIVNKLRLEASVSYNDYNYKVKGIGNLNSDAQFMPRIASSYQITNLVTGRLSLSRGFSPPTLAEIRPSDTQINNTLMPESGWNYETGLRFATSNGKYSADFSAFMFKLENTIVRRVNANDTDFFINAGSTSQPGIEFQFSGWLLDKPTGFVKALIVGGSVTAYRFTFSDYTSANTNYSGNWLTGVPKTSLSGNVNLIFPVGISLYLQHRSTSSIPLDDANSVYASSYQLLDARLSYHKTLSTSKKLTFYVAGDNLLNTNYSLGNDLNAFGKRFYNPAMRINFYGGMRLGF